MSNLKPVDVLKQTITQMQPQFKNALPSHISVEKFSRVLMTAIGSTPKLAEMDRNSVLAACMKAAQDGLLPDGKEAALVPFKGQAQYLPMFAGILKKMRNSGELLSIEAHIVHRNDKFMYRIGIDQAPVFEPDWFGDRGEPIGVFAVGKTKDGGVYVEIMSKPDVYKVKAASSNSGSSFSPWNGSFEHEMWKKTVIRRLAKKMPSSTDLDGLFSNDDENYDFKQASQELSSTNSENKDQLQKKSGKKKTRLDSLVDSESVEIAPVTNEIVEIDSENIPI